MKSIARNQYFTLDILNKKIRGSKRSFKLANKGCGDAYNELMNLMTVHPDFELEVIEISRSESKITYDGLKYEFMIDYINLQDNGKELLEKMNRVKASAKRASSSPYPIVKKWFLDEFSVENEFGDKEFDMKAAEKLIKEAKEAKILADAA
jgi:hypothetical protein